MARRLSIDRRISSSNEPLMMAPLAGSTEAWPDTYMKSPAMMPGLKGRLERAPLSTIFIMQRLSELGNETGGKIVDLGLGAPVFELFVDQRQDRAHPGVA